MGRIMRRKESIKLFFKILWDNLKSMKEDFKKGNFSWF